MSRRVFTREFKIAAVKLIVEDEMDVKDVSKQLGVHANSLYRWVQEYEEYGESAFHGKGCKILSQLIFSKGMRTFSCPVKIPGQVLISYFVRRA